MPNYLITIFFFFFFFIVLSGELFNPDIFDIMSPQK